MDELEKSLIAIKPRTSKFEILESAMLMVSMGGGPKMMYMKYVIEVLDV